MWLMSQAVVNAYVNQLYAGMVGNIKAIVFLGTPHRGADSAQLLSTILTATLSSKIFVKQLRPKSEAIQEINKAFRDRSLSLTMISYFESKAMPTLGVNVLASLEVTSR
jgi:hypothetical protein